jgi:serine/threonine protein kinase
MLGFEDVYQYSHDDDLGSGSCATVFRCVHRQTGIESAVKVIDKCKVLPVDIVDARHECRIMRAVSHSEYVLPIEEIFDTRKTLYVVLELLKAGTLFDRIAPPLKPYPEASAVRLLTNLLLAVQHIHSKGVIHRDLKPENLLLRAMKTDTPGYPTGVCLADFGVSVVSPGRASCGSRPYMAPEVVTAGQSGPYDTKSDMWSVGVITYAVLSGYLPFNVEYEGFSINSKFSFFPLEIWENVTPNAMRFIEALLKPNPQDRPSAKTALEHPWIISQNRATDEPATHNNERCRLSELPGVDLSDGQGPGVCPQAAGAGSCG